MNPQQLERTTILIAFMLGAGTALSAMVGLILLLRIA